MGLSYAIWRWSIPDIPQATEEHVAA
jgi:hypothetical protein